MSADHIPFDKMSDLFDGDISSREERDAVSSHIEMCPACAAEYRHLVNTMQMCRQYASLSLSPDGLTTGTIRKFQSVKRRKLILKSLPAMAASILVIAGVGFFSSGFIGVKGGDTFARRSASDSERVIEVIQKQNATITQVTGEYVEGTAPVSTFAELKRQLGSRKVAYILVDGSEQDPGAQWGSAMEAVGLDDQAGGEQVLPEAGGGKKYILFRVFR
jgi:anti-sigma factor RsiW